MTRDPLGRIGEKGDPDLIARDAWEKMKRGVSLKNCAYHARLHVGELDRIIWSWCCRGRGKHNPTPAVKETPDRLAPRRFSWQ